MSVPLVRRVTQLVKKNAVVAAVFVVATTASAVVSSSGGASAVSRSKSPSVASKTEFGYWLAGPEGVVRAYGGTALFTSAGGKVTKTTVVGMAATPDARGYWLVSANGKLAAFGDARLYGSLAGTRLEDPVVGMAATPDGRGYWLATADGGVFAFGNAQFNGSVHSARLRALHLGALHLRAPVVGIAPTTDGHGYWLVARDGGVFAFGDAGFMGSAPSRHLGGPIVAIEASPKGNGYWLVASDGTVIPFGGATNYGSAHATRLNPLVGMALTPDGGGYWLATRNGSVIAFGDASMAAVSGDEGPRLSVSAIAGRPVELLHPVPSAHRKRGHPGTTTTTAATTSTTCAPTTTAATASTTASTSSTTHATTSTTRATTSTTTGASGDSSFSLVGSFVSDPNASPVAITNTAVGDLRMVTTVVTGTNQSIAVSGGGVTTWHALPSYNGTYECTGACYTLQLFWGVIASTGSQSLSVTNSGTFVETSSAEFTAGPGYTYSLQPSGGTGSYSDTTSTVDFPSLVPSGSDELYFGYATVNGCVSSPGPTLGFHYYFTDDCDAIAWSGSAPNPSAPTATQHVAGSNQSSYGSDAVAALLVASPSGGGGSTTNTTTHPTTTTTSQPTKTSTAPTATTVPSPTTRAPSTTATAPTNGGAPTSPTPVCGTAILQSPFNYTGTTGPYTSGTAGLPTYGTPSSDFPNATAGVVVGPSGFNVNSGVYNNSQTVYYFEPGNYLTAGETLFPGFDAVYIGGYANGAGAVLDAQGENNGIGAIQPVDQNGNDSTDVTLEYLTVKDYASSKNSSVINTPGNNGWVEEYDTIGPNEYAYPAASGQDNGGGYGIDLSSHNVIAYDCLINNAQGAINMPNGAGSESGQGATLNVDSVVTNNEISFNGLGEYPDDGNNPQSCGCSGGGKFSWSTNFVFEDNYVHDNYNAGIWGDFNNSGANISYNYIAYNWSWGVMYEASYNANISDNTLIGNGGGKMSDGSAWPSTSYSCNSAGSGSPTCAEGYGPNTGTWGNPYGTIQLNGSGGNSLADSNFNGPSTGCPNGYTDGCVLVQGNVLTNNFGAVQIFEDSGRASGTEPNQDGQCNSPLQGADSTYYQNTAQESDGDISTTAGSTTITSGDGGFSLFFSSQCTNPGPVTTPAAGLNVITNTSDIPYGDQIASCSSASTCTLTTAATGTAAGLPVDLSGTGGCSLADLTTANGPVQSPGTVSGSPPAAYWDNCLFGARNTDVTGNTFSIDTSVLGSTCTQSYACGVQGGWANDPGVKPWWNIWAPYYDSNELVASSALSNVFSHNTYSWTGSGAWGNWEFLAGQQGQYIDASTWQSTYGQDGGSTGV